MSAKPTPPCVRALDADGSEFFLDARGLAWRCDSSRVPELDGPPAGPAALDRADVVAKLALLERGARFDVESWAIVRVVDALGLRAEFDAACEEVGRG